MSYKKSLERKEQILECAKHLFALKGYQATQIADICEELHIARGTVYQYFDNKEDIFHTLIKDFFDSINRTLTERELNLDGAGAPTLEELQGLLIENTHAFLKHIHGDRDIGRIILHEGYTQMPDIAEMLKEFFGLRKSRIMAGLRMGMALGILRKMDAELLASAMLGSATRVVLDFIIEDRVADEDHLRKMAEELVNFQLRGILAK